MSLLLLLACSNLGLTGDGDDSGTDTGTKVTDTDPDTDADADTDTDAEWFEVQNVSDHEIELQGVELRDGDGAGDRISGSLRVAAGARLLFAAEYEGSDKFTVSTDAVLAPGDRWVLAVSDDVSVNGGLIPDCVYDIADFKLVNDDDEVVLQWGGDTFDAVAYTDTDFPDKDGKLLALDPAGESDTRNDDADWWRNATTAYGSDGNLGTPGDENDVCSRG